MIKTILQRPLAVLTVFVLLTIIGIFMVFDLPVDLMPDMDPPYIYVATSYPAAGPEEIEEEITDVLEEQLYTLQGLEGMTSTSSEGMSGILLEFSWGDDADKRKQDIRDELDILKNRLPDDAQDPVLYEFDPNSTPIVALTLEGDRDVEELYTLAEELVKPELEQVPNISKVEITGGREEIVKVAVSTDRLDAYGLTVSDLANVLGAQNMTLGAGSVDVEGNEFLVRTSGEYQEIDQINNTMVTSLNDAGSRHKIYVRDVAEVAYGYEERTSRVLMNGQPAVHIEAYKKTGSNTVDVAEGVRIAADESAKDLPLGTSLSVLSNESEIIEQSLSSVLEAAAYGIFFSILVLLLFLRQMRTTLIIAITIPVSILITIIGMSLGDKTFNTVALTGLTLGVGMIVDNSIVILENIYSHRQQGVRLLSASRFGTAEMITSITASTLTTIFVFLPILLFGDDIGAIGAIMNDMAFTVIMALVASLVVALLLVPVLSAHYLSIHTRRERPIKSRLLRGLDRGIEAAIQALTRAYRSLLDTALRYKFITVATAILLLVVSVMQFPKLGLSFTPPQPEESVVLNVELPLGSSLSATEDVMDQLQSIAEQNLHGYTHISQRAGGDEVNTGQIEIVLPDLDQRPMSIVEMKSELRDYFDLFPDVSFTFGGGRMGPMGGGDFTVQIQGDNLSQLIEYSEELQEILANNVPELTELSLNTNSGLPQWDIELNRAKLYDLGLNASSVATEIRNQLAGTTATTLSTTTGDTYDVVVQLQEADRQSIPDLERLFMVNPMGQKISVASLAAVRMNTGPETINHIDEQRAVTLSGDIVSGVGANVIEQKVREIVEAKLPVEPGLSISYGGEMDNIRESGGGLLKILIFAVLLVFGVLVSQFESLKAPFIIISAMPMLAIGVIGIYLLMGETFSMISLIGVVMLVGIVVNNGIVLVDYTTLLRKRGQGLREACLNAGSSRLRPILMTTLTTILAMTPLAFFAGEGSEQMQPLAITVVGGLTINTIITLVFVPVVYSIIFRKEARS